MQDSDETREKAASGVVDTSEEALAPDLMELARSVQSSSVPDGDAPSVGAEKSADAKVVDDVPICDQGPCVHYVQVRRRVLTGDGLYTDHSCRMGVKLVEENKDQRVASMPEHVRAATRTATFPETCNQWRPRSEAETADLEERRMAAQDRLAEKRKLEAVLDHDAQSEREAPEDPGAELPDGDSALIPKLPDDIAALLPPEE